MNVSYDYGWTPMDGVSCRSVPQCLTVSVDGITFTGSNPGRSGYGLTGWSGWLDGLDAQGGPRDHETADGGFEAPVYLSRRKITLEGLIMARDKRELWQMCDRLAKVCTTSRYSVLVVTEEALGLSRQVRVCRLRKPQITPQESRMVAVFTLELESPSAPKLSTVDSVVQLGMGATEPLVNQGDYPADLAATMTGPLVNPVLTWPGGRWVYTGTIPDGETRTVDFTERDIVNPASSQSYRLSAAGVWPVVRPGQGDFALSGSGSGSVELRWRSAWI